MYIRLLASRNHQATNNMVLLLFFFSKLKKETEGEEGVDGHLCRREGRGGEEHLNINYLLYTSFFIVPARSAVIKLLYNKTRPGNIRDMGEN